MTLNGLVALILRYFTELCSSKANRVKVVELCRRKKFSISSLDELLVTTLLYYAKKKKIADSVEVAAAHMQAHA